MIISHTGPTAGYIAGLVFIVISLLALVIGVLMAVYGDHDLDSFVRPAGWMMLFTALIVGGIMVVVTWPTNETSFHRFYQVEGTVQEVTFRQFDTRYAVRLKESGQIFGCDDTRCSTLKPGDHIALNCKKEWEYQAVSGWACRWNQR